ncbi:MAG: hypothetical protein L0241_25660, partial [Planctomycetia bacterium]|nr:hypothetical protein [Planctomycetia bacterium]
MIRYFSAAVLLALVVGISDAQPMPIPLKPPASAPKAEPIPQVQPMPIPVPPVNLKAPKAPQQPTPEEAAALSKGLRELALKNIPKPLVKANDGWGKQKEFVVGGRMLRNPKRFGPEAPRAMVNDGLWRRFTVTAREPEKTLAIGIEELTRPELNTTLLTVNAVMDVDFRMEQQFWKRGIMLYSGETRGHCSAGLKLKVKVVSNTEQKPGSFLPNIVLTIKVTDAKLFYDKVVIDHTAGLDGEDARAVGELVIDLVKAIKPDLEKQLLEKANAAIMKSVGSKEIKVPL